MKTFIINNNSDSLLLFFSGWGCDEYEFEHLKSDSDVLIFYDYSDLDFEFDFSKYKNFNLIAFSAGVFIASIMDFDFKISKKIAISGNPYLFDEKLGLSKNMQDFLCGITEETADDFARNYLIKTNAEWKFFHHSKRTLESINAEFESLKNLYKVYKSKIKDIYDFALISDGENIFDFSEQKKYYGKRLNIINNARHNIFYRINSYNQILFNKEIL